MPGQASAIVLSKFPSPGDHGLVCSLLWQAVSSETSTWMNFIDKNAGFDARILFHDGFDFFDRSVEDTDACYFTIAHRANYRQQPLSAQSMISASMLPDDFFDTILVASLPKLQNQQAITPGASAHLQHIFIGNGR